MLLPAIHSLRSQARANINVITAGCALHLVVHRLSPSLGVAYPPMMTRLETHAWLCFIGLLIGCSQSCQAMSSGLPVVAVAAGGLVDILRNTVGEAGAPGNAPCTDTRPTCGLHDAF
jgi:hypothetical protein